MTEQDILAFAYQGPTAVDDETGRGTGIGGAVRFGDRLADRRVGFAEGTKFAKKAAAEYRRQKYANANFAEIFEEKLKEGDGAAAGAATVVDRARLIPWTISREVMARVARASKGILEEATDPLSAGNAIMTGAIKHADPIDTVAAAVAANLLGKTQKKRTVKGSVAAAKAKALLNDPKEQSRNLLEEAFLRFEKHYDEKVAVAKDIIVSNFIENPSTYTMNQRFLAAAASWIGTEFESVEEEDALKVFFEKRAAGDKKLKRLLAIAKAPIESSSGEINEDLLVDENDYIVFYTYVKWIFGNLRQEYDYGSKGLLTLAKEANVGSGDDDDDEEMIEDDDSGGDEDEDDGEDGEAE
jgi:hypothetical protein